MDIRGWFADRAKENSLSILPVNRELLGDPQFFYQIGKCSRQLALGVLARENPILQAPLPRPRSSIGERVVFGKIEHPKVNQGNAAISSVPNPGVEQKTGRAFDALDLQQKIDTEILETDRGDRCLGLSIGTRLVGEDFGSHWLALARMQVAIAPIDANRRTETHLPHLQTRGLYQK
jgi:hypothetical protein